MSLQQAYSGYALNQTENDDPISKGLTAGSNAYNSGASASAYGYLSGQNAYPVAQLPSAPYESIHGISGQYSQQGIAQAAKDAPFRGKYTSSQELADQVQTKPGIAASLINTALPAYVGYKFLVPDAAKNYLAETTGFESLGAGTKAAEAAKATQAVPTATTATAPEVLGEASGKWAPTTTAPTTVAPVTSAAAGPELLSDPSYYADPAYTTTSTGTFLPASNGIAGATAPLNATAGEIGYVYDSATGALTPATAEQLTAANISGGTTAAAGTVGTEAAAAEGAASMGGADLAALTAEYGPYIAAAIAADQLLFDGKISRGIDDAIIQPLGDLAGGILDLGGDIVEAGGDLVSDFGSSIGDVFGWAEGGPVGGISAAAQRYNLGGYSDGGRLLKGPGDGVSDSIPATIGKTKQPARLADGEFVVPARIVSELGNGSTEAGARKLYAMMDRIQKSRKKSVGKGKVAVNSRADKHLPA